ncbi:hypothetical protein D3C87_1245360 [compost metagenome]
MAGADIAEVARRHAERHLLAGAIGGQQPALEVVDHLGHHARPVDRIDRADGLARLESVVIRHRLDDVLGVVEHAFDGQVEDVRVLQAEHLRGLERAHLAVRAQHEHADAILAAHRVLGRAAGVAGGCPEDVQLQAGAAQCVLEQVAEQLHRHVLEGQRRAVRQAQQLQRRAALLAQRTQRGNVRRVVARTCVAVHLGGVGLARQRAQVVGGDVVAEAREDLERQVGVGQLAPGFQFVGRNLRVLLRQVEPAVRRQAAQQDLGERLRHVMAARRLVLHERGRLSSVLPCAGASRRTAPSAATRCRGWRRSRASRA